MAGESGIDTSKINRDWNHHPELPVPTSPLFEWPPKPVVIFKWLAGNWLTASAMVIEVLVALLVYRYFHPGLDEMVHLEAGWILRIWACNMAVMIMFAGSMHLYLYSFRKQGSQLKYDHRDMAHGNRVFTFSNQVHDNIFWSLASGVTVWTLYQILYFWAAANGYVPLVSLVDNPVYFLLLFPLIPIWSSFHFYWIHRWLHWPPLYRLAHSLHHRNINIGPWSGLSMHPIEHLMYLSSLFIHFIIPSHPVHFLFHAYFETVGAATSHAGFEGLLVRKRKRLDLGDFFHQLHHRYFECNYGNVEMPWDRWFGSYHDGSEQATRRTRERRKAMYANIPPAHKGR